ncbi:hypothetical protein FQA39_LY12310 [Lamprigera yunnana]|nr:hypothetical protein FQA39_LY12310 [Lamprigera yunnana]
MQENVFINWPETKFQYYIARKIWQNYYDNLTGVYYKHKAQNKSVLENENINLPDSSANNHDNNQPGTSSSTPGSNKRNCTFEELLLETVKQAPSEPKKAKNRIGKGAEVITCIEHSNQTTSTTKSLTLNGNSESELSDPVYEDDDDDIEAKMR